MIVGRVTMIALIAAVVAGCAGSPDAAGPDARAKEAADDHYITTHPPPAPRAPATQGSVAVAPSTEAARPARPVAPPAAPAVGASNQEAADAGPAGGSHTEPSPSRGRDVVVGGAMAKAVSPAAPGTQAGSVRSPDLPNAAEKNVNSPADRAGATPFAPEGELAAEGPAEATMEFRDTLVLLRDRTEPGRSELRGGPEPPSRAFSRSTIDDCTVIRRLGDSMALSRSRGASESEAVTDGIDRLAGDFGLPRDERTKFTSRVYGILIYRLEATHTTQAFASYALAVCRVYRETNQIIPVDPVSERAINDRLRTCDGTTAVREELEDCILRGLFEIVARAA